MTKNHRKTKCQICKKPMYRWRNSVERTTCSNKCGAKRRSNDAIAKRPAGTWWCCDCQKHLPIAEFGPALSRSQCRKHSTAYDVRRERELKKAVVAVFGGGCSRCGYARCMAALDLHHLDPSKKEVTWGEVRRSTLEKALKKLKDEDLVLICSNCHREEHWGLKEELLAKIDAELAEKEPVGYESISGQRRRTRERFYAAQQTLTLRSIDLVSYERVITDMLNKADNTVITHVKALRDESREDCKRLQKTMVDLKKQHEESLRLTRGTYLRKTPP